MKTLTIGNVTLDNPFILAPMAGVTDLPFRILCKEQGAGMVCMEMVSAKALYYKNKNTQSLMESVPSERPVSLQLFGSEPELMAEMAKQIEDRPFDILDINMGCPVPKVVNNGEGSALMNNPLLVGEIVSAVSKAIQKPVTVKIRKGFDDDHVNAVEIARIAQESGAAAVAVHGRTRQQYYAGKADWEIIRQVKEALTIPVIGNGDVTDVPSAQAMFEQTGCDGIMVARAAQGNPWIFRDLAAWHRGEEIPPRPDHKEIHDMMIRHARMAVELKGEYTALREMRKHIAWYTYGLPHSSKLRGRLNEINTLADMENILTLYE